MCFTCWKGSRFEEIISPIWYKTTVISVVKYLKLQAVMECYRSIKSAGSFAQKNIHLRYYGFLPLFQTFIRQDQLFVWSLASSFGTQHGLDLWPLWWPCGLSYVFKPINRSFNSSQEEQQRLYAATQHEKTQRNCGERQRKTVREFWNILCVFCVLWNIARIILMGVCVQKIICVDKKKIFLYWTRLKHWSWYQQLLLRHQTGVICGVQIMAFG